MRYGALLVAVLIVHSAYCQDDSVPEWQRWSSWRGPYQNGVAHDKANPPVEWSEEKNVKWKIKLTGLGHSTPVVWGDYVFLTSAQPFGPKFDPVPETAPGAHDNHRVTQKHRFLVTAVSRKTGKVLWNKNVKELIPHEGGHFTGSLASASPLTDGKYVYAFFGSHGLYCLDFKGNIVWGKAVGQIEIQTCTWRRRHAGHDEPNACYQLGPSRAIICGGHQHKKWRH